MNVSEVMEKMIKESKGSFRDINHFLKVWGYARNIGKGENLDDNTQKTLEIAAIVHDISCPSLREKYGEADGKKQEEVSSPMIRKFFEGSDISKSMTLPASIALSASLLEQTPILARNLFSRILYSLSSNCYTHYRNYKTNSCQ